MTANLISVRSGRGFTYSRLGYFHKDDQIFVLDPALDQKYAQVIWQIGYAYSAQGKYLQFSEAEPEEPVEVPTEPNAVVTAGVISVREARTVNSTKLGELKNGDKIVVLDGVLDQNYAKIVWDGGAGYAYSLSGKYIQFLTDPETEIPTEPNAVVTAECDQRARGRAL